MKNIYSALLFCILIISLGSCTQTDTKTKPETTYSGGKLFIIGGGSRPASLINSMIDESGIREGGYALVLPMATTLPDRAIESGKKQFTDNGISAVGAINFIEGEAPTKAQLDSVRNAKLIYIPGGSQNRFMGVVAGTEIEKAIWESFNKGNMIAGTSAGAAVMSEKMITGTQLLRPDDSGFKVIEQGNTDLAVGLGFIKNAIIDQHFVVRSRFNRLLSLTMENPNLKCIGIDESTAIVVSGDKVKVVGLSQVLVFDAQGQAAQLQGTKLGTKDINLSIYLDGDEFSLN
ncbi:cyanophycinase [Roseivirga sp.]|uniref:cyanophycinase n=1 Tax=Roseivirga sp. TaxID=1964215 RepID=UPI002B272C41|nr:cyanophycinase [Roseivirga sp.]